MQWFFIVACVLVGLGVLAVIGFVIARVSSLFNRAEELIDEVKDADVRERETPKSLNAMDGLLIKQIMRDFPEYNMEVVLNRVKRDARLFYESAAKGELLFKEGVSASMLENTVLPEGVAGGILIHRAVLSAYDRKARDMVITYQAAVQYDGTDERHHQTRLNLKYIAAYSSDFAEKIEAIKCPNCGGPVPTVGEKICPYCGSALMAPAGAGWVLIEIKEG